jgi:polyphosphate kinase 2 (PPK2 family)
MRLNAKKNHAIKRYQLTESDLANVKNYAARSRAESEMLARTHTPYSPWFIADCANKQLAKADIITHLLSSIDYLRKDQTNLSDHTQSVKSYIHKVKF